MSPKNWFACSLAWKSAAAHEDSPQAGVRAATCSSDRSRSHPSHSELESTSSWGTRESPGDGHVEAIRLCLSHEPPVTVRAWAALPSRPGRAARTMNSSTCSLVRAWPPARLTVSLVI